ncbi:pyruvate kinase-like [Aethina tumida]|uniref:pyruvate kinase-like n=1 Tax=Aethina tumida TaxID=116153 RepID=UPI002147D821|nr:pyruvate kinase-like [Aethina tumida]
MNFKYDSCPPLPWMVDFHATDTVKVHSNQLEAAYVAKELDHLASLNPDSAAGLCRCTKIFCTITSNQTCKMLEKLLKSGINGIRVAFPKFDKDKASDMVSKIKGMNADYSKNIGRINPLVLLLQLNGPQFVQSADVRDDEEVREECVDKLLKIKSYQHEPVTETSIVNKSKLPDLPSRKGEVFFDKRWVPLTAIKAAESVLETIVHRGLDIALENDEDQDEIASQDVSETDITTQDKELLIFAVEQNMDCIIVPGVLHNQTIRDVRRELNKVKGGHLSIIAKIDTMKSLQHADEIIARADGIHLDSAKLMKIIPKEKIFLIEKSIIAKCIKNHRLIYVTTSTNDRINICKSEICDIANIVMESVDGFIIPEMMTTPETVTNVHGVCREAEPAVFQRQLNEDLTESITLTEPIYGVAISVISLSLKCEAAAIICTTSSGRTAQLLSMFRPRCPIIAVTKHKRVARKLSLFRGCEPLIQLNDYGGEWQQVQDKRLQLGVTFGKLMGFIRGDDVIVTLSPTRPDSGFTNSVRVFYASFFDDISK